MGAGAPERPAVCVAAAVVLCQYAEATEGEGIEEAGLEKLRRISER